MQTADADAGAVLEVCRCMVTTGKKGDAVEERAIMSRERYTERGQIFLRIRHEALAAGLVDRGTKRVGDQNIQAFLPQGDCGRRPAGPHRQ